MSKKVEFTSMGYEYSVRQPLGSKAQPAFHRATKLMVESGAMAILDQTPAIPDLDDDDPEVQEAKTLAEVVLLHSARQLVTHAGALAEVKAVLIGGTLEGEPITRRTFAATYAEPGRHLEPFHAAIMAWGRMRFFTADAKPSETDPADDEEDPDPSGND